MSRSFTRVRRAALIAAALALLGAAPALADPSLTADPATGLDAGGQTVDVAGSGIALSTGSTFPGAGLYAAQVAVIGGEVYAYNAGAKYIRRSATAADEKLNDDGTFATSVGVVGSFVSGATEVDCADAATQCLVAAWPAHDNPTLATLIDSLTIAFAAVPPADADPDPDPGPGPGGGSTSPVLFASPTFGLPAGGASTATVLGSGFSATANGGAGVYVVYGPRKPDYWVDATVFGDSRWVHPGGAGGQQAPMNADGSFAVTLSLAPSYVDGSGNAVNCTVVQCYVMTFAAHGSADRSQDTAVPVTFAGTAANAAPAAAPPADPAPAAPETGTPSASAPAPPVATATPARISRLKLDKRGRLTLRVDRAGTLQVRVLKRTTSRKHKVRWRQARTVRLRVAKAGVVTRGLGLQRNQRYRLRITFVASDGTKAAGTLNIATVGTRAKSRARLPQNG
jgi:hypothetical protein